MTEERGAQLHHHGAHQFVTSGTLEIKEISRHVISMLVEHAVILGTDHLQQVLRSQILPFWALALRIVAVELGEGEVVEILADEADPSITTIETDIMIPGIAH